MALVYHNITPPEYFLGVHEQLVRQCYHGRRELLAYREARRQGRLPLRTVCMPLSHQLEEFRAVGLAGPFGDDELSIGAMKFYADGSLIAGTAVFSEPYGERGEFDGLMLHPDDELEDKERN